MELVVYCGLLGIFTTLFVISLPSRDNRSLENLSQSTEQSALVLTKLGRELANSNAGRVSILDSGAGLAFPSPLDTANSTYSYDASGALLWRSWIIYIRNRANLNRTESTYTPVTAKNLPAFPGVANLSGPKTRLVCANVEEFKAETKDSAFQVTLTLNVGQERVRNVTSTICRN